MTRLAHSRGGRPLGAPPPLPIPLVPSGPVVTDEPHARRSALIRATDALVTVPGVPMLLARSRFTTATAGLPESVRLTVFRETADTRGLSDLLPTPPWERSAEEIDRARAADAARRAQEAA